MIPLFEVDLTTDSFLYDGSVKCFFCLGRDLPKNPSLIDLKYALDNECRRVSFSETFPGIFLLPQEPSLARMQEWFVSRSAVVSTLRQRIYTTDKGNDVSISIAHTAGIGVVGIINHQAKIGVDVERADRVIQQNVVDRIANVAYIGLVSGLDLWLVKEAVFKASQLGLRSLADVAVTAKLSCDSYVCQTEDSRYRVGLFVATDIFRISVCTQLANSF